MIHEHAIYPEPNESFEKQIRTDALLTRQLRGEERDQALKQSKQVEYDVPFMHHVERLQVKMESNEEQLKESFW